MVNLHIYILISIGKTQEEIIMFIISINRSYQVID